MLITQLVKGLTKYNQTVHTPRKKYIHLQIFMSVGISVIEILLFNRKKKNVKIEITSITPVLQAFLDFLQAFNMFSTLLLVEVKLSGN